MATKETREPAGAATATIDATPAPQTPDQIAATEQALGLTAPAKTTAVAKAPPVPVQMGVAPKSLEEAWRMAQFIAQSELVPKQYRGRPADVLVAIQYGMEVGLPPLSALHSIFITNGRPSLWGDGFLAVIMASPSYKDHDEYFMVAGERREFLLGPDLQKDDTTAVVTFWRKDSVRPRTGTFSIAQAKKAGLWSKEGPWQQYPDRMLKFRARGFAGHDGFPDVLRGIRTAEEVIDLPPAELEAPREVRRISQTPTTVVEGEAVPAKPAVDFVTLEPVTVKAVEQFLGGYTITLSNGQTVDATEAEDAIAIEQFAGTAYKVRITAERVEGHLSLRSFVAE